MPRTIIVAATPPEAAPDALALAADLARAADARLVVAGVAVAPLMVERAIYADAQRGAMERELGLLLEPGPAGVACTVSVVASHSVTRGLHRLAEQEQAELLVLGPSHRGAVLRAFQGDLMLSTLHDSPCPLAVAPAGYADRAAAGIPVVGVALDGGEESDRVLDHAIGLADGLGAALRIVHVATTSEGQRLPPWLDPIGTSRYVQAVHDAGTTLLEDALTRAGDRVEATTVMLDGHPNEALVDFAAGVNLLVMGSRAYGTVGRVLIGTTAGRVLHNAPCAVLIAPNGVALPAGSAA